MEILEPKNTEEEERGPRCLCQYQDLKSSFSAIQSFSLLPAKHISLCDREKGTADEARAVPLTSSKSVLPNLALGPIRTEAGGTGAVEGPETGAWSPNSQLVSFMCFRRKKQREGRGRGEEGGTGEGKGESVLDKTVGPMAHFAPISKQQGSMLAWRPSLLCCHLRHMSAQITRLP